MKLYTDTHRLAVWLIVLVVAGSSVNLALETRDIVQLYATIRELDFTMSTMALQSNSTSTVILAQLRADNRAEYGGLEATQISLSAYFSSGTFSLFQQNPLVWGRMISSALYPLKSTTWNFTILLNPLNATALDSFYQNHDRDVTASVSFQVLVTTSFLHTFTGAIFYQKEQDLALSYNST